LVDVGTGNIQVSVVGFAPMNTSLYDKNLIDSNYQ
jgi:hypothetical protein